jgi:hypothetical protein
MAEDFERFELEVTGEGAHERWNGLAQELIKAYPPGTDRHSRFIKVKPE